ncbi:MAG: hypothetical protein GWN93_07525, partial [Deltaproteobacteria bacterium]|nr:hypothetical protein [Deltaproteobacteria bacterium]
MKRWKVWGIVAAAALVVAAAVGYWTHARPQAEWYESYLPLSLEAKGWPMANYYVDNSAPCPGLGTQVNPWCDFSQVNTLVAGDVLLIRGNVGSYQVYDEPEIDVTVSGTAANPITIRPYGTEMVEMRSASGANTFDLHGDWLVIDGQSDGQLWLNKANRSGAYA